MKKIISLFIVFTFLFQLALPVVEASGLDNRYNPILLADEEDCSSLFGDKEDDGESYDPDGNQTASVAYFLQEIFTFIKFLGPALVVIFTVVEFAKAAAANDKDALLKAGKKTGTRIALALLLFFLPVLIDYFFDHILHWYGTCGIN